MAWPHRMLESRMAYLLYHGSYSCPAIPSWIFPVIWWLACTWCIQFIFQFQEPGFGAGCVLVSAAAGGLAGLGQRNGASALRANGTGTPLGAGTKDVQMLEHQRMAQQAVA